MLLAFEGFECAEPSSILRDRESAESLKQGRKKSSAYGGFGCCTGRVDMIAQTMISHLSIDSLTKRNELKFFIREREAVPITSLTALTVINRQRSHGRDGTVISKSCAKRNAGISNVDKKFQRDKEHSTFKYKICRRTKTC